MAIHVRNSGKNHGYSSTDVSFRTQSLSVSSGLFWKKNTKFTEIHRLHRYTDYTSQEVTLVFAHRDIH